MMNNNAEKEQYYRRLAEKVDRFRDVSLAIFHDTFTVKEYDKISGMLTDLANKIRSIKVSVVGTELEEVRTSIDDLAKTIEYLNEHSIRTISLVEIENNLQAKIDNQREDSTHHSR